MFLCLYHGEVVVKLSLSDESARSLCTIGVGAIACGLGAFGGVVLATGAVELMTGSGQLALEVAKNKRGKLAKLETAFTKNIAKAYQGWIKVEFANNPDNQKIVQSALDGMPKALAKSKPTINDMMAAELQGKLLANRLLKRLDENSQYRTSPLAAGIFKDVIMSRQMVMTS